MSNEEIKNFLVNAYPDLVTDETGEFLTVQVEKETFRGFAENLRQSVINMDYLFCLTCVDWKTHLTMVYHFSSTNHRNTLVVKVKLDRENPQIETICDIWRTAEFHEREVYEMFGVTFINHPDLRKLILPDDFVGFPLRKDFEDTVNMVKL